MNIGAMLKSVRFVQLRDETGISKLDGASLHTRCSDVLLSLLSELGSILDRVLVLHPRETSSNQNTA